MLRWKGKTGILEEEKPMTRLGFTSRETRDPNVLSVFKSRWQPHPHIKQ